MLTGGTLTAEHKSNASVTYDIDLDQSYSAGIVMEFPLKPSLRVDFEVNVHDVSVDQFLLEYSQMLLHVGAGPRLQFRLGDGPILIRPGVSLGYGYLAEKGVVDASDYTILNASTELVMLTSSRTSLLMETSLLWALGGGDDRWKVTGGPVLLFRAGLLF